MIDLSFADVSCVKEMNARFILLAKQLMSKYEIRMRWRPDEAIRISSLELYLYNRKFWRDPTVHGPKRGINDQLESGNWYFHRYSSGSNGAAKRMGLDITAGSKSPDVHVGLLIRGINGIDGSGRAVNSIVQKATSTGERNWKYSLEQRRLFKERLSGSVWSGDLSINRTKECRSWELFIGPRIGLPKPKSLEEKCIFESGLRITTHPGRGLCRL